MKTLIDLITEQVTNAFTGQGYDAKYGKVTLSNRPDLCEYQCNGAMAAAKEYKCAPFMISDKIAQALAENELIPLLTEAEKLRPANNMLVNSCDLSLRYLNNLRLLAHIDEEVRIQNQSHTRFLLSDTNALLHSLIREGDASFVYEKIGTTIDTVMIDEFQDTSRMQWENFHLLLQESLAQKEGSLIVGDIKQSIYRWRNGDWKILAGLGNDPSFRIRECSLGTNWRSEANIIRFNNGLFTAACQVLNDRYEAEQG